METPAHTNLRVSTDYPGGNGCVQSLDETTVKLEPEFRDSTHEWFYWNVTLQAGTEGNRRISFGDHEVVGPRGPAIYRDGSWGWLGAHSRVDPSTFTYEFDAGERVRFAVAPSYQLADFESTYRTVASNGRLHRVTLTTSEQGRSVPLIRVGSGSTHIVVTARHHACESTASYVLDGLLRHLLQRDALPPAYCVHLVPFVDIDGVERGDQGKHRAPHDHNRDYVEGNAISDSLSPIYRSTGAIMRYIRGLDGEFALALDLHCPYKWGGDNDRPFFVADPEEMGPELSRFASHLATASTETSGSLTYSDSPGTGIHQFNGQSEASPTFRSFADSAGATLAATLEVPYVGTEEWPVTPGSTRALGRALGIAVGRWVPSGESG